jgi:hypothetical protein
VSTASSSGRTGMVEVARRQRLRLTRAMTGPRSGSSAGSGVPDDRSSSKCPGPPSPPVATRPAGTLRRRTTCRCVPGLDRTDVGESCARRRSRSSARRRAGGTRSRTVGRRARTARCRRRSSRR